ncbi:MAG: hypothetical protein NBV68_17865 [Erythrobacter sp.]|uniref:hypothetical protein n=1 Tax=Erythrobacter sp. TaxID=1042 RepID=UPI0025D5139D|nr:hypothetical protein [Erythrobacter sp.]MCM0001242.1 hypothetical protein [Erythrobacter sp.]
MIDDLIDRADAISTRWQTVLSVVSTAWFAATCADYAGFLNLPKLGILSGWSAILVAALWNAVWWGFAYPRIEARRKERNTLENLNG